MSMQVLSFWRSKKGGEHAFIDIETARKGENKTVCYIFHELVFKVASVVFSPALPIRNDVKKPKFQCKPYVPCLVPTGCPFAPVSLDGYY